MDIETRAKWYADRLTLNTKSTKRQCIMVRDDIPETEKSEVMDLVHAAHNHGHQLPNDWRYAAIYSVLCGLTDAGEDFEPETDIYTHDLLAWLSSRNDRVTYCDEAVSEGLVAENAAMADRIMAGQYMEYQEIKGLILQYFRDFAPFEE